LLYLNFGVTWNTIIANLIGGLLFFWIDRFIFTSSIIIPQWEIKNEIQCVDCGEIAKGFRLVRTKNYDKTQDKTPEFRCGTCSEIKLKELKTRGIIVE
jgi:hypothetical protein